MSASPSFQRKKGGPFSPVPSQAAPPPDSLPATALLPRLGSSASKRLSLAEDPAKMPMQMAPLYSIKAVRSGPKGDLAARSAGASRLDTPALPAGRLTPSTAATAAAERSTSATAGAELQVQMLGRALEESRAQVLALTKERAEASDRAAQILAALGDDALILAGGHAGGRREEPGDGDLLGLVYAHVKRLQESLQIKEVEVAESKLRHEAAATEVVRWEQALEQKGRQVEDMRHTIHSLEEAQHALQLKVSMLETQAADQAAAARRRMEDQTASLKGEAAMARAFQERCAAAERQLEDTRRSLQEEKERAAQLQALGERTGAQLAGAQSKQALGDRKLLEVTSSYTDLEGEHRAMIERNKALVAANWDLQAAVADHKERALLADTLKQALEVQRAAGEQLQAALQEDARRLTEELQREREQKLHAEQALCESRAELLTLRAAAQGKGDEIASLLSKLDEYSDRLVQLGDEAAAAAKQATVALDQKQLAEELTEKARRESASLRDSLVDMAAAEERLKQQLEEAQGSLSQCQGSLKQQQFCSSQMMKQSEIQKEQIRLMQATLAEQAQQLEALHQTKAQCSQQRQAIGALEARLVEAEERCGQLRQALLELTTAKEQSDKAAYKLGIINDHLKEQQATLTAKLTAEQTELAKARGTVEDLQQQVAAAQQAVQAQLAAREHEYELTKSRNEDLEHLTKQQSALIADLDSQRVSLASQHEAALRRCRRLQQLGAAYSQAYGRLSAHAGELHAQFAKQLGSVLHLCRHVGLQLEELQKAAEPVGQQESHACHAHAACAEDGSPAEASGSSCSDRSGGSIGPTPPFDQWQPLVRLLDGLRAELGIATQLLEAQSSSTEVQMLAGVPAGIAAALQEDLSGAAEQTADLLAGGNSFSSSSSSSSASSYRGSSSSSGLGGSRCCSTSGNDGRSSKGDPTHAEAQLPGPVGADQPQGASDQDCIALAVGAAQVAQMEGQLGRLMHDNVALKAAAQAAAGLHERELAARQHMQEALARLKAELCTIRGERDAFEGQRDLHEGLSRELARKLREAAYAIRQLQAGAEGPILSLAHRGLLDRAAQTQHCELWLRNVGMGCAGPCDAADAAGEEVEEAAGQAGHGVPGSSGPAQPPVLLPLHELQHLIREIYKQKATQDIAVARGRQPFTPLPAFLESYVQLQHGAGSKAGAQRLQQLAASVLHHTGSDREIALFGISAGLLREEELAALEPIPGAAHPAAAALPPVCVRQDTAQQQASLAPLALYHGSRPCLGQSLDAARTSLRVFQHSSWHTAYLRSAARQLAAGPHPLLMLRGLDICSEVRELLLSVPGVGELLQWVAAGGVAGSLRSMDLGLPLAENQVPQLYLLAVDACRLLGIPTTPHLYIRNASEAAAYYLQVPAQPGGGFHGLNGSLAADAASQAQPPGPVGPRGAISVVQQPQQQPQPPPQQQQPVSLMAAAEPEWECVLVLTSGLVDLLEPGELQAVMAGCLGLHAALVCKPVETTAAGAATAAATAGAGAGQAATNGGRACQHFSGGGGSGAGEAERLRGLCRSLGAMHTLGALCALCPEALSQRLPPQLAPLFVPRIQPVLLRGLRYLSFYCDRFSLAATGDVRMVATALAKLATGSHVCSELNLDAMLQQAQALEEAAGPLLPGLLSREEGATLGAASSSLAIQRIWHLLRGSVPGAAP